MRRSILGNDYAFVLNMCTKLPTFTSSGERNDFTPDSIPQIFNYTVCSRPIVLQNFASDITSQVSANFYQQIRENWVAILVGVIGAIVVIALYILILRFTVKIIVWLSIVGSIIGVGVLAAYLLYMYAKLKENNQLRYDFFGYYDETITKKQQLYEAFGIILAIIACIGIVLTLIFCKTIKIAIAVISCSI